ncbi:MAG TPA: DUF6798 domain-containing protein [Candidatus Sulfotelmatobacter sp.]|nr:DUF6798 domain-containing protein [Candidatus Sulfotelmatobacter sp.]
MKRKDFLLLALLTGATFFVHGYHPAVEDAAVYNPSILKSLHPQLYPFGSEFFELQSRLTLYPQLIAYSVRLTHLSLDTTLFAWQILTSFLLLFAAKWLISQCFESSTARWAGVCLIASLFTLSVAGTALYIKDEYLTPRAFALIAALLMIVAALRKKYWPIVPLAIVSAVIHPMMFIYGLSFIAVLAWVRWRAASLKTPSHLSRAAITAVLLPFGFTFKYPSQTYIQVIHIRRYFFLAEWHWYEWLGLLGPIAILWGFARLARRRNQPTLELICIAAVIYQSVWFLISVLMTVPPRLIILAHYQPLRSLQLTYVLMFLIGGAFLGEYVLRRRVWLWLVFFAPLCFGMFYAQRQLFPASQHIEWPGRAPTNEWLKAFSWIRDNTPTDAIFALNPDHMHLPGEDEQGFRAVAQRSTLADAVKDSAPAAIIPEFPLAEEWKQQTDALASWTNFQAADFARLHRDWKVTWVVIDQASFREIPALDCLYANHTVLVCKTP